MLGNIAACLLLVYLLLYFIIYPIILYFRDPKGLRKYPNLSLFSGITNVPYMIESSRGRRSERLAELHQKHPIIRIGPNSLSFGACEAIKVGTFLKDREPLVNLGLGYLWACH